VKEFNNVSVTKTGKLVLTVFFLAIATTIFSINTKVC